MGGRIDKKGLFERYSKNGAMGFEDFIKASSYLLEGCIVSPDVLIPRTLFEFGCNVRELRSKTKERRVVDCRHALHHLLRAYTPMNARKIGLITHKDRTTVIASCKTASNLLETNKTFRTKIENIKRHEDIHSW